MKAYFSRWEPNDTNVQILVVAPLKVYDALRTSIGNCELSQTWSCIHVESAAHALARLQDGHFDLVVGNAYSRAGALSLKELARAIRATPSGPPVVAYTVDRVSDDERLKLILDGVDEVVWLRQAGCALTASLVSLARRYRTSLAAPSSRLSERVKVFLARPEVALREPADLRLTRDQMTLITVLLARMPNAVSHADLASALGYTRAHNRRAICEAIRRLRLRLKSVDAPFVIEPVPCVGYRICEASYYSHSHAATYARIGR